MFFITSSCRYDILRPLSFPFTDNFDLGRKNIDTDRILTHFYKHISHNIGTKFDFFISRNIYPEIGLLKKILSHSMPNK